MGEKGKQTRIASHSGDLVLKESPAASCPSIAAPLTNTLTDRLDLRRCCEGDLDELSIVFSHPEVWKFPFGRPFTVTETETFLITQIREWENLGFGLWIARERASGRVIGYVGLTVPTFLPEILPAVEVGWRFEPAAWGKGLASEGARAALESAFTTLGLDEVCSITEAENARSGAVCERIGMRLEREIAIPASSNRGELEGLLYRLERKTWHTQST